MASKKLNYVTQKQVSSLSGDINILLGAWSNGKSFSVKSYVLSQCYKNNCNFAFIVRLKKQDTAGRAENYFLDAPIEQITKGEYTAIVDYRHDLYFANYDKEKAKYIRGRKCGHRFNLFESYQDKSTVYVNFKYGIFEEFITLDNYLPNEVNRLQRLLSTISRNNTNGFKLYMIGNTISPICPYFRKFELTNVPNMKYDQKDRYELKTVYEDGSKSITTIEVLLTHPVDKKNNLLIGHDAKEGNAGAFHVEDHNQLTCSIKECTILYNCVICYEGQRMLMQFIRDPKGAHMWYVTQKTTEIQEKTRTFGQIRTNSKYHTNKIEPLTPNEAKAIDYLRMGKICYQDNLTGTLFMQMLRGIMGEGFQYE